MEEKPPRSSGVYQILCKPTGKIYIGCTVDLRERQKVVKTYTGFINPSGQRVLITNLAAFCRANGLHPVRMHNLISGERHKHKGWIWRNDG
jgi:hypothetical protein